MDHDPFEKLAELYGQEVGRPGYKPSPEIGRSLATCLDAVRPRHRSVLKALCGFNQEPQSLRAIGRDHAISATTVAYDKYRGMRRLHITFAQRMALLRVWYPSLTMTPEDPDIALEEAYPYWHTLRDMEDTPPTFLSRLGIGSLRDLCQLTEEEYAHRFWQAVRPFRPDPLSLIDHETYAITRRIHELGLRHGMDDQSWRRAIHSAERLWYHLPEGRFDVKPSK